MSTNHRSFWKYFWPSLTANFASSFLRFFVLFFLVILIVIISAIFGGEEKIKENTILHLTLDGGIGEQTDINLDPMSFSVQGKTGLSNLLYFFHPPIDLLLIGDLTEILLAVLTLLLLR